MGKPKQEPAKANYMNEQAKRRDSNEKPNQAGLNWEQTANYTLYTLFGIKIQYVYLEISMLPSKMQRQSQAGRQQYKMCVFVSFPFTPAGGYASISSYCLTHEVVVGEEKYDVKGVLGEVLTRRGNMVMATHTNNATRTKFSIGKRNSSSISLRANMVDIQLGYMYAAF